MLASNISIHTEFPGNLNEASTFDVHTYINSNALPLGVYDAWCLNAGIGIKPNSSYTADLYASSDLEGLQQVGALGGSGQNLENMGGINWLLNWYNGNNEGINSHEVQSVIWKLMGDDWTGYFDNVDESDINHLYDQAITHKNFVPGAGDAQILVLDLKGSNNELIQPLVLEKIPAVPEAEVYVMLLAGLMMLGVMQLKKQRKTI